MKRKLKIFAALRLSLREGIAWEQGKKVNLRITRIEETRSYKGNRSEGRVANAPKLGRLTGMPYN